MKIFSFCLLVVFVLVSNFHFDSLDAMSWPSDNPVIENNFGANNSGKPILGMVFSGASDIAAVENGTILFSSYYAHANPGFSASRLPSPLGAWTAVDHGDGLISIYSRHAKTNKSFDTKPVRVERQQQIAASGISGWSSSEGFYLMIFDRRERRWINPAMILTPMQDLQPPQILSVQLRNAQGNIAATQNLTQGRYTVFVNVAGGMPVVPGRPPRAVGAAPFAPHRIVISVNGAEVSNLAFEAVSARDGTLMVSRNGLVPARQVYANFPAFEAAEIFLTRGQVTMEVFVQDITGASRSVINRFIVN